MPKRKREVTGASARKILVVQKRQKRDAETKEERTIRLSLMADQTRKCRVIINEGQNYKIIQV